MMYHFRTGVIIVIICFSFWTNVDGFAIRTKREEMGCQFHEAEGFALYGHNDKTFVDSTLTFCKQKCLNQEGCLSIDYNNNTLACFISSDSRDTAPSFYGKHIHNNYYEKFCGHDIEDWDPEDEDSQEGSGVDNGAEVVYEEGHCMMKYGPYGRKGGTAFNDMEQFFKNGNITAVHVRYGNLIDGLGFTYGNSKEEFHGNPRGGKSVTVKLMRDEYITAVQGRKGLYFDQLSFITNKKVLGPYGPNSGKPFSVDSDGRKLAYISGSSGQLLDQLVTYFYC